MKSIFPPDRLAPPAWSFRTQVVPGPAPQALLSVIDPGPPPASLALTCSSTTCVSMVAPLSILLRPLFPIASISRPMIESMPKMSTTLAIMSSIRLMPDSDLRFLHFSLLRILVIPSCAIPDPALYSSSGRDAGGRPSCAPGITIAVVINESSSS